MKAMDFALVVYEIWMVYTRHFLGIAAVYLVLSGIGLLVHAPGDSWYRRCCDILYNIVMTLFGIWAVLLGTYAVAATWSIL